MAKKKECGIGAQCSVLLKYMHPAKVIGEKFPQFANGRKLENLLVIRQELKTVRRKEQVSVVFCHDDFEGIDLHCVKQWVHVTQEGHPDHFFNKEDTSAAERNPSAIAPEERNTSEEDAMPPRELGGTDNLAEDIAMMRLRGAIVDDDNKPAPENVPLQPINDINTSSEGRGTTTSHCQGSGS